MNQLLYSFFIVMNKMKFKKHSFSQVKKTEEFNSFIIRLVLGSVATTFAGVGIYYDILHVSFATYLMISVTFYCLTFAIFVDLFRQLASTRRRYVTLFIDIFYTSFSIYVTAGETQVLWLFYIWLYIGYGSRYGKDYLFAARLLAMSQYVFVIYISDSWSKNSLDLMAHMLILFTLPYYILAMIKRLHLAKSEAIKVAKLKSQFLASMSHEIRTPLNGIIGTSHLLSKTSLDSLQKKYTNALIYSSEILLSLINNILDFSKIEANKIELNRDSIAIRQCIKKINQSLLFNANQKQIELHYQVHDYVPEQLIGDQKRLNQILLNLVGNAIKFTHQGQVSIDVTLDSKTDNSCTLLFKVKDTGIGISSADQKIIFKRFTQVGSESALSSLGTGLGTTISKELIEIMGGFITIKSELGKGSEFRFTLLFDLPVLQEDPEKTSSLKSEELNTDKSMHILIAEDDDINAMILEQFLLDLGHYPVRVTNGLEVLEQLHSEKFDLIFMDLHMPKVSGLEATRKIRAENKLINIIGLTANATTEHKQSCLQVGMNDFLCKPITPLNLKKAIDKIHFS
jgi:signal transduction histidine kinase